MPASLDPAPFCPVSLYPNPGTGIGPSQAIYPLILGSCLTEPDLP